jgi:hypothetical protein
MTMVKIEHKIEIERKARIIYTEIETKIRINCKAKIWIEIMMNTTIIMPEIRRKVI